MRRASRPGLRRVTAVVLVVGISLPSAAAGAEAPLIAVDVGHSLARSGAVSARGKPEFEFNRALALVVERVLRERGFRTRLIGVEGDMDKLTDRTAAAAGAAFFLSLHHDSAQPQYLETWLVDGQERRYTDRFSGFSLFVSRTNPVPERSVACASAIGAQLRQRKFVPSLHHAEPIRGENRPVADALNGIYYFDDLIVLKTAPVPAVLVEAGIILNRRDELSLSELATRERLAEALSDGLLRCLGRRPPPASAQQGSSQ